MSTFRGYSPTKCSRALRAQGDNATARATATGNDKSVAYAGKNATATAASAQGSTSSSVSCGGGNAYAANKNGRTFCVSSRYYSFTYAPNKVDLQLTLPKPSTSSG
ncbi:hypothetical protein [Actinomycetospora atypica]|uniref:Uncharacterized protein n=1 Tax=Actinomycetospora atypica TaxID=1290095 RepID=A0ABV9YEG1_9PSEU